MSVPLWVTVIDPPRAARNTSSLCRPTRPAPPLVPELSGSKSNGTSTRYFPWAMLPTVSAKAVTGVPVIVGLASVALLMVLLVSV